jgi:hypothetical protein
MQVVNGPEVLSKYVGQAEENIRNLFGEAEAEYKEKGDSSVSCAVLGRHCLPSQRLGRRGVGTSGSARNLAQADALLNPLHVHPDCACLPLTEWTCRSCTATPASKRWLAASEVPCLAGPDPDLCCC